MRWLLLLLLLPSVLVLETSVLALESTNLPGYNLAVYGSYIAYEYDNNIHLYNIDSKQDLLVARGNNPSLFGYILAFDAVEKADDVNNDGDIGDTVVYYYNIQDKSLNVAGIGRFPHVFSKLVIFSTKESDLNVDFSNDRDAFDDILRIFSIDNGELVNLKAVGYFPVANRRSVAFLTSEDQAGLDLNDDGDKVDDVLRILDLQTKGVASTQNSASDLAIGRNFAVFSSDVIKVLDMNTQETVSLPVSGNHPAIFDEVVVFERDGNLFAYDLELSQIASLGIKGAELVLFEDLLVFISDENVVGDLDGDGIKEKIIRFSKENFDNLPYEDCDSAGDYCAGLNKVEKKEVKEIEEKQGVVEKNISSAQKNETKNVENAEAESSFKWYLLGIVLIVAVFVGVYYGYRYHQKRKKSFGF